MAKQESIFEVRGTIGNVTFFKGRNGHRVRKKTSLNGKRIANDPKFKRTRENGVEFGSAAGTGKHIRHALAPLIKNLSDPDLVSRLTRICMKVLKTDTVSTRGNRQAANGNLGLLKNIEFNANAVLKATMSAPFSASIERATGIMSVQLPAFVPERVISLPAGATHFMLTCAALALDLPERKEEVDIARSAILPWNEQATAPITLEANITPGTSLPLFLAFGIEFYQEANGIHYLLSNGTFTALSLVEVNLP